MVWVLHCDHYGNTYWCVFLHTTHTTQQDRPQAMRCDTATCTCAQTSAQQQSVTHNMQSDWFVCMVLLMPRTEVLICVRDVRWVVSKLTRIIHCRYKVTCKLFPEVLRSRHLIVQVQGDAVSWIRRSHSPGNLFYIVIIDLVFFVGGVPRTGGSRLIESIIFIFFIKKLSSLLQYL